MTGARVETKPQASPEPSQEPVREPVSLTGVVMPPRPSASGPGLPEPQQIEGPWGRRRSQPSGSYQQPASPQQRPSPYRVQQPGQHTQRMSELLAEYERLAAARSAEQGQEVTPLQVYMEQLLSQDPDKIPLAEALIFVAKDSVNHGFCPDFDADRVQQRLYNIANEMGQELARRFGHLELTQMSPEDFERLDPQVKRQIVRTTLEVMRRHVHTGDPQSYEGPRLISELLPSLDQYGRLRQGQGGNCEDLTGIYLSCIQILRRGGIDLPIQPVTDQGHISAAWCEAGAGGDPQERFFIEPATTREGILEPEEVPERDALPLMDSEQPSPYRQRRVMGAALAAELINRSFAFGEGQVPATDCAIRDLEWAVQLDPLTTPEAYSRLAAIHEESDPEKALHYAEHLLRADPTKQGVFFGVMRLRARVAANPEVDFSEREALLQRTLADTSEALQACEDRGESNPELRLSLLAHRADAARDYAILLGEQGETEAERAAAAVLQERHFDSAMADYQEILDAHASGDQFIGPSPAVVRLARARLCWRMAQNEDLPPAKREAFLLRARDDLTRLIEDTEPRQSERSLLPAALMLRARTYRERARLLGERECSPEERESLASRQRQLFDAAASDYQMILNPSSRQEIFRGYSAGDQSSERYRAHYLLAKTYREAYENGLEPDPDDLRRAAEEWKLIGESEEYRRVSSGECEYFSADNRRYLLRKLYDADPASSARAFDEALAALNQAIALSDPEKRRTQLLERAGLLYDRGHYQQAEQDCSTVIEDPDSSLEQLTWARISRGMARAAQGDADGALGDLRSIAERCREYGDTAEEMIERMVEEEILPRGLEEHTESRLLQLVLENESPDPVSCTVAVYDEGISKNRGALRRDLMFAKGELLYRQGRYQEAEQAFTDIMETYSGWVYQNEDAYLWRALVRTTRGDKEGARADISRAASIYRRDGTTLEQLIAQIESNQVPEEHRHAAQALRELRRTSILAAR